MLQYKKYKKGDESANDSRVYDKEPNIDWKNLSSEQVEMIMDDHDHRNDGCPVCSKLAEYGKIPEDDPDEIRRKK